MKSTYDVVAIVVVRRFEADNKCWPSLKKMALQTDLSNLRLHPAPHHAIGCDQWYDTRSTGGRFERMWCDTTDREMTPSNSLSLRKITVRCAHGQAYDT